MARDRSVRPDVLLVASNPGLALAASRCLWDADLTFELVSTGRYPAVRSMRNCVGASRIDAADLSDAASPMAERLRRALDLSPSTTVVPAGLAATFFLSRTAWSLPAHQVFPVSAYETLRLLDDKWRFGELLGRLGQPHPETVLVAEESDVDAIAFERMVVKPLAAEGSLGVRVIDSVEDLRVLVRRVGEAGLLPVLVQQFVEGDDMGVNVIVDRGEVLGSRVQRFEPDGRLSFVDRPDAVAIAAAVMKEVGGHGVFNLDLRREASTDRLFMTECNPRLYATSHKSAYAGMNPVALGIELARSGRIGVPSVEPLSLQPPLRALAQVVRRHAGDVDDASRRGMEAEVRNPVSSVLRLGEQRLPGLAARVRGDRSSAWAQFDSADGRSSAW